MTDMTVSETLNKAADLIEERGWTQGNEGWCDGTSGLCLEGALLAAMGLSRNDPDGIALELYRRAAYWVVAEYLDREPIPKECPLKDSLWQWNDVAGRSHDEVVATLRAAAVIAESRVAESALIAEVPC